MQELPDERARDAPGGRPAPRDILVLRDPRESPKRCSLTPLRGLAGVRFLAFDRERVARAEGRVLLHTEGDELTPQDAGLGLLLLDCSWRRVPSLLRTVEGPCLPRRLPSLCSAYPRRSRTFADPAGGLASVEALYAACAILGCPDRELLAGYRWAEEFLAANPGLGSGG